MELIVLHGAYTELFEKSQNHFNNTFRAKEINRILLEIEFIVKKLHCQYNFFT
jgi:acyl-CoA thioesterase FadM